MKDEITCESLCTEHFFSPTSHCFESDMTHKDFFFFTILSLHPSRLWACIDFLKGCSKLNPWFSDPSGSFPFFGFRLGRLTKASLDYFKYWQRLLLGNEKGRRNLSLLVCLTLKSWKYFIFLCVYSRSRMENASVTLINEDWIIY